MKLIRFILLIIFVPEISFGQELAIIRSNEIEEGDYRFETTIGKYQEEEDWRLWSFPFHHSDSSMNMPAEDAPGIITQQMNDSDLNTSCLLNDSLCGLGKKFEFLFHYSENEFYGSAYQFYGKINVFNGNCSSLSSWTEYSRVKTMKVYLNEIPVCIILLSDTWHFQQVDLCSFFKNKYTNTYPDAPYEIKDRDKLVFEIMEIYPGKKYKDAAISEFLVQGASN